jgi:hypothetical protein
MAHKRSVDVSKMLNMQNSNSFILVTPDVSAGRTASELWHTSQELSPAGIIIITALNSHLLGDEL